MPTTTKKELIDRIAENTQTKRVVVKSIIQEFLNNIVTELAKNNRIEFRDFGVFEAKSRQARKAQNPKTLEPVQVPAKRMVRFKVGRLDDFGYVKQDRDEMEVLFTLLAYRYERGTMLITSNLPFSKWEIIFKDPMTTAAAIDRLVHHSVVLELNVPSYRVEQARKRKDRDT